VRASFLTVACAAIAVCAALLTARPAAAGTWYWSPGLCKISLHRYGMRLDDGRTFRIVQSYCVGKGGPSSCEWNSGHVRRLYNHFVVFARSYDGIVRGFDLYPTNRSAYRAQGIQQLGREPSAAHFDRVFGQIAAQLSRRENAKGCAP
jgi:hypothetical protein